MTATAEPRRPDPRPLIAHVVYRFDTGGLENGLANLINHLPEGAYRHVVVALTEATAYRNRVQRKDVEFIEMRKGPGHGVWLYPQLYRLFRRLKPQIVHTRNLAALECVVPAWAAGVPRRVHSEHGRDVGDLDGRNSKYQWLRRIYKPWVSHYIALSGDLAGYLRTAIGIAPERITQIINGVDVDRFHPAPAAPLPIAGSPFNPADTWLIGTVGRMQAVKDQAALLRAFGEVLRLRPDARARLRLALIGDGPERDGLLALATELGVAEQCWLPGERRDVAEVMRGLSCFVLPSLAEGISNTILEAMSCGLPVIASAVGGNPELVTPGRTGELVPPSNHAALTQALLSLVDNPQGAAEMGRQGRTAVETQFSLEAMVSKYRKVYDQQLAGLGPRVRAAGRLN